MVMLFAVRGPSIGLAALAVAVAGGGGFAQDPKAGEGEAAAKAAAGAQNPAPDNAPQVGPDPIPEFRLPPVPTQPFNRSTPRNTWIHADAAPLPKDREGIWVLEFAYRPVRVIEIELPNKQRKKVYYLFYRVVNRTGKARPLVPQFALVDDDGRRYEDLALPTAVQKINAKEDPTIRLLDSVQVVGEIPASTREGIDEAVYGVAIWPEIDHRADGFQIYVRGLSDAYQEVTPPEGGKAFTRYKALRLDFDRPGDERAAHSGEIRPADPPFEWTYFP
jgi:hypothetical protein